ncbi:ABC-2 type transport system ATP-binding protein [Jatrophihabitans endophyticus]|uniref:ABC-2 type transport system ATP-binding protein n=1 Tax=Jatrophihabitans endophyticus TaxID=1206085 RepID=A0A1M5GLH1_9ACTN|nr:ABC transporter ATP-binding protein [Jatrophihabitans endophyticus]SHG04559.1 ABC-2 type transport system ATP-binding protein [Jatrophihabitans endophyticus]
MTVAPAATALRVERVSKALAGREVLREVSFACPAGQITALLGPNGAGKTTTVTLATGVRRPDAGQVRVLGRDVREPGSREHVALVAQGVTFPAAVGVDVCLRLVAGQRRPTPCSGEVTELYSRLGVDRLRGRRVGGLSGGQRRRLAVAMALLHAPEVVVLDEATSDLDERYRAETWQLLREYTGRGGCVLVTSHILADIERHADRVVALVDGQVALAGTLGEVRARLGGSSVEVTPAAAELAHVAHLVRAHDGGEPMPAGPGRLRWHTHEPLRLLALLAAHAPTVADPVVGPVPLADLLESLLATTGRVDDVHGALSGRTP